MKEIELAWYAGKIIDNHLYFFSEMLHSLFKMDLETKDLEWLDVTFDKDFIQKSYGIKSMIEYEGNLFLWSMFGIGYCKVNLEDFSSTCNNLVDNVYTSEIIMENAESIIISSEKPWLNMWRFDLRNEILSQVDADITRIKSIIQDSDSVQCTSKIGDKICFPVIQKNYILVYDISQNKFDYVSIPNCSFYGVTGEDGKIFLSQYSTYDIVEYDFINRTYRKIKNQYGHSSINLLPAYSRILKYHKHLLTLPCTTDDKIEVFDIESDIWKELEYPHKYEFNKKEKYLYSFYGLDIERDRKICVFQLSGNMLLEISLNSGIIEGFHVIAPKIYSHKIREIITQYGPVQEGIEIGLSEFLSVL